MTRQAPNPRHLDASRRAAEASTLVLPERTRPVARARYSFDDGPYDFWYALGFLLAPDHVLADDELAELIASTREVPTVWRSVICRSGPDSNDRGFAMVSRDLTGQFSAARTVGIQMSAGGTTGLERKRSAFASDRAPDNAVSVFTEDDELIVEVSDSTIRSTLWLCWWASDDVDESAGVEPFMDASSIRSRSLRATLRGWGTDRRIFCVISDTDETIE